MISSIAMEMAAASPLQVDVGIYDYKAIGSLVHPNHFVLQGHGSMLAIGTAIVVSRNPIERKPPATKFELGFGIVFEVEKPKKSQSQSQKKRPPTSDYPKEKAKQRKSEKDGDKDKDQDENQNQDQDSGQDKANDLVNLVAEPDPTNLGPAAQKELQALAGQMKAHEEDLKIIDENDLDQPPDAGPSGSKDRKPQRTDGGGAAQDKQEAKRPKPFSGRLGLCDLSLAKRKGMVCYLCNGKIEAGNYRFHYNFSQQKATRSIHVDCVGQIARASMDPSLAWLREQVTLRRDTELLYIEGALQVLGPLSGQAGQAASSSSSRG